MQKRPIQLLLLLLALIFGLVAPSWAGTAGTGSQEAGRRTWVNLKSLSHPFVSKPFEQVGLVEFGNCGTGKCSNSFSPETEVLLVDRSWKKLKDFDGSETLLADNPETPSGVSACKVEAVIDGNTYQFYEIGLDTNGDGIVDGNSVKSTPLHPFFTRRGWVYARDLKIGDEVKTDKNLYYTIRKHDKLTGYSPCYNLSVEVEHCYFVKVAGQAVVVHNARGKSSKHGNCKDKPGNKNHVYEISSKENLSIPSISFTVKWSSRRPPISYNNYKPGETFKYGIHDGAIVNNESPRAVKQIKKLKLAAPGVEWYSTIVFRDLNSLQARQAEQALVSAYFINHGHPPLGNKSPTP
jgi:Pretoxin HINT domain/URI fold toxin 2